MLKHGVLEALRDSAEGLTRTELCAKTGLSDYAMKCLLEASLNMGTVLVGWMWRLSAIPWPRPAGSCW